jgi:hypothetical protein
MALAEHAYNEFLLNHAPEWIGELCKIGVCPRCVLRFLNIRTFAYYQASREVLDCLSLLITSVWSPHNRSMCLLSQTLIAKFAETKQDLSWSKGISRSSVACLASTASDICFCLCADTCVACLGILETDSQLQAIVAEIKRHDYEVSFGFRRFPFSHASLMGCVSCRSQSTACV